MPVVNGINYNEKMITDLEELMILAHRINQFEEGCVFVNDNGHVDNVEFRVAFSKECYFEKTFKATVYYGRYSEWNNQRELQDFKRELINLYENLKAKKVTPPASNE